MMLLDTSGLLCCFDADDVRHAEAVANYQAAARRVTHSYVLAEFVAPGRRVACRARRPWRSRRR